MRRCCSASTTDELLNGLDGEVEVRRMDGDASSQCRHLYEVVNGVDGEEQVWSDRWWCGLMLYWTGEARGLYSRVVRE